MRGEPGGWRRFAVVWAPPLLISVLIKATIEPFDGASGLYDKSLMLTREISATAGEYVADRRLVLLIACAAAVLVFVPWISRPKARRGLNPLWHGLAITVVWLLALSASVPANRVAVISRHHRLLSASECAQLVAATQKATVAVGWSTSRHRYHPTEDIPLADIPSAAELVVPLLEQRLFPIISRQFCDSEDGCGVAIRDMFIVRYSLEKQAGLEPHVDGHHVSFNIALNVGNGSDFAGGGTGFVRSGVSVSLERGSVLIHGGKVKHFGVPVTGGVRYILVGFCDILPRSVMQSYAFYFTRLWGALASEFVFPEYSVNHTLPSKYSDASYSNDDDYKT